MLPDGLEVFLLAHRLGRHPGLAVMSLDPVIHHFLERRCAFVFYHAERMGEFPVFDGRARLEHLLQRAKKLLGPLNILRRAVQLDPALARSCLHAQFGFQRLQISRLVVE